MSNVVDKCIADIEEQWTSQAKADMDWENEVSKEARWALSEIQLYGPTIYAKNRELKGCIDEGDRLSFTSEDLRKLSTACLEAAEWLDKRAEEE